MECFCGNGDGYKRYGKLDDKMCAYRCPGEHSLSCASLVAPLPLPRRAQSLVCVLAIVAPPALLVPALRASRHVQHNALSRDIHTSHISTTAPHAHEYEPES